MSSLFPTYAHPAPGTPLDLHAWWVFDRPSASQGSGTAGTPVLGRVDLQHGDRPLADVLADVERWSADGVPGLFFDRPPLARCAVGSVALAVRAARRRGLHRIVLNPGTPVDPAYRELDVDICTFEGSWTAYQRWSGAGARPGDGHLVHDVPTALLTAARQLLTRRGAGFGVATDARRP